MKTALSHAMAEGLPGAGEITGQLYWEAKPENMPQAVLALDILPSEHPTPRHFWKEALLESLGSRPQVSC